MIQARISDEAKLGYLVGLSTGVKITQLRYDVRTIVALERYSAAAGLFVLHHEPSQLLDRNEVLDFFDDILRETAVKTGAGTVGRFLERDRAMRRVVEKMARL